MRRSEAFLGSQALRAAACTLLAVVAFFVRQAPPVAAEIEASTSQDPLPCDDQECRLEVGTYNVRGIFVPQKGLESRKKRFPRIAGRLEGLEILMLQELFLRSKTEGVPDLLLDAAAQRAQRVAPSESERYYNSGLAVLLQVPEDWIVDSEFEAYDECHGDLLPISHGNDCLARKGVLFVRLALPFGELDLYTTHVDAGSSERDKEVKSLQHEQMARFVEKHSGVGEGGRAVVLGGDFNSRLDGSDEPSKTLVSVLGELGLRSVGDLVEPDRDLCAEWRKCGEAQIDHLFVRGSKEVGLSAESFLFDELRDPESELLLSDHPLVVASLVLRRSSGVHHPTP